MQDKSSSLQAFLLQHSISLYCCMRASLQSTGNPFLCLLKTFVLLICSMCGYVHTANSCILMIEQF